MRAPGFWANPPDAPGWQARLLAQPGDVGPRGDGGAPAQVQVVTGAGGLQLTATQQETAGTLVPSVLRSLDQKDTP